METNFMSGIIDGWEGVGGDGGSAGVSDAFPAFETMDDLPLP